MNYFIINNGQQEGPYTPQELLQHGLKSEALVWAEGMADWEPAWKIEELRPLLRQQANGGVATPPPVPSDDTTEDALTGPTPPPYTPATDMTGTTTDNPQSTHTLYTEDPYGEQPDGRQPSTGVQPTKSRPWGKIIAGIAVVLAIIMAVSNPSANDHKQAIRKQLTEAINKHLGMDEEQNGFLSQMMGGMARMVALSVLDQGIDSMVDYHNYIICSKTTFHLGEKSYMSSFGIFGHVFTADEEQLTEKLGQTVTVEQQENTETSPDGTATTMTRSIKTIVGDSAKSITTRMGKQIGSAVANKVGEEVKKEVSEKTDSTTSSGIGHIVDEIVSLFE